MDPGIFASRVANISERAIARQCVHSGENTPSQWSALTSRIQISSFRKHRGQSNGLHWNMARCNQQIQTVGSSFVQWINCREEWEQEHLWTRLEFKGIQSDCGRVALSWILNQRNVLKSHDTIGNWNIDWTFHFKLLLLIFRYNFTVVVF